MTHFFGKMAQKSTRKRRKTHFTAENSQSPSLVRRQWRRFALYLRKKLITATMSFTKIKETKKKGGYRQEPQNEPDFISSLQTNPLGNRSVLLESLRKLLLDPETLVRRLEKEEEKKLEFLSWQPQKRQNDRADGGFFPFICGERSPVLQTLNWNLQGVTSRKI